MLRLAALAVLLAPSLVVRADGDPPSERERTVARRSELKQAARVAGKDAGAPRTTLVPEPEQATGVDWAGAATLDRWTVVGTVGRGELRRICTILVAVPALHRAAFGGETAETPPKRVALVLDDRAAAAKALAAHPAIHAEAREEILRADSLWLDAERERVGLWYATRTGRAELAARQAFDLCFERDFGESLPGWVRSGAELYLVHRLVGTRFTFVLEPSRYGKRAPEVDDLMKRALRPGSDWLAIARGLLRAGRKPDLRAFIGKATNDLSDEEQLWAYVLAAYMIEARGDDAATLFRAISAGGERLEEAVGRLWSLDLDGLEAALVRWLDATRDLAE